MYNSVTTFATKVNQSTFKGNSSSSGGAIYMSDASVYITNSEFIGNTGSALSLVGVSPNSGNTRITNSSFSGNEGSATIYDLSSFPTIANSVIWGNNGIAIRQIFGSTLNVTNSIVEGGYLGDGNLDVDPRFIDQPSIGLGTSGDLSLQNCSPAIDAGNNSACITSTYLCSQNSNIASVAADLAGNSRRYNNGIVDIGAYEVQSAFISCNQPPVANCRNLTVFTNSNCQGTAAAANFNNGSSDPDQNSLVFTASPAGPYTLGATTVTLTVSDGALSDNCTATVTVVDNVLPIALCQNATVQLDASGNGSTTAAAVDAGSNDACGIQSTVLSQTAFGCSEVGANAVVLTVTDVNGNVSTCNATVTVEDNVLPVALCQNVTVQLDATGNGSTTAAAVDAGSNDACGIQSTVLSQTTFGCSEVGANAEVLTVTDVNGNVSTCNTTVTVEDGQAPTINCPANMAMNNDVSQCSAVVSYSAPTGTDNCPGAMTALTGGLGSGAAFPVGATTETYTVTDAAGLSASCSFVVTVHDTQPPTAVCRDITVDLAGAGQASITAVQANNGSSDNCNPLGLSLDRTTFDCDALGQQTVTLTATDPAGNSSTCTALVAVINTDADSDGDGIGDGCDPSIDITGLAVNLSDYVENLDISSSVERSITRRLDLLVSRFCNGSSVSTVVSSANSLISYVQNQSGNGIPADAADYLIAQLQALVNALYAGAVDCGNGAAARTLPGLTGQSAAAENYSLEVYPNPFSGQATIRFYLPRECQGSLEVFNLQGQRVRVLETARLDAGIHQHAWDGSADGGQALAPGVYLLRLSTEDAALVKKVSLMR